MGDTGPRGLRGEKGESGGEQGVEGIQGEQGVQGPSGAQGVSGSRGQAGKAGGPEGPAGQTGQTGEQGEQGIQGVAGEPVQTHHLDTVYKSVRKVVLVVAGFSTIITVVLVFVLVGLANQGDEDLVREIDENARVTRETATKTQVELTQHHYFDSCVFLVLTAGGVERTPQEARDVIRRCSEESDSLRKAAPVDDVLERNYPNLFNN